MTKPEANNCFSIFSLVFLVSFVFLGLNIYFKFAYFFISNFHKTAILKISVLLYSPVGEYNG
jgi:hypothetical protein